VLFEHLLRHRHHLLAQVSAGAGEAAVHHFRADAQEAADLGMGVAVDVVEGQRQPLRRSELRQGLPHDQLDVGGPRIGQRRFRAGQRHRADALAPGLAAMAVHRDLSQPAREAFRLAELCELAVGLHEGLLGQIARGLELPREVVAQSVHHVPVPVYQLPEGVAVAAAGTLHEVEI